MKPGDSFHKEKLFLPTRKAVVSPIAGITLAKLTHTHTHTHPLALISDEDPFRKETQDWVTDIGWLVANPPSLRWPGKEGRRNPGLHVMLAYP